MSKSLIIKINQCSEQVSGPVKKLQGLLPPKSMVQLLDIDDLAANPRSAKKGSVTADIEDSLKYPELFPAKTKGILLASSNYKTLDRDRYQLIFVDSDSEGILDGGHNALAVGRHILRECGLSDRELNKVKDWEGFKAAWNSQRETINEIVDVLDFQMPIEIQVPADMTDDDVLDTFRSSLLEIGAARNNNVQLSEETKANKKGFYELYKKHLPTSLVESVEWKTNDGGRIKARDIIALSWVVLSKLELPDNIRVSPNQIYRNKGVCVAAFNKLVENEQVSSPTESGYAVEIHNEAVQSALRVTGKLPQLYDLIFKEMPSAYNRAGGSFGKINAVKLYDPEKAGEKKPRYLRVQPTTPFFQIPCEYTCPDGFIVPLLFGFRSLLDVDKNGLLSWKVDPEKFVNNYLVEIIKSYRLVIEMAQFDPQKIGKNISAYEFAESAIAAIYSVSQSK